jgi:hypothetical protein
MNIMSPSSIFSTPFFSLLVLCSSFCLNAAPVVFQSSENQTSLLELYTSEGCSSCPPAEAWLSGLKESRSLWREFVPIAFHVDYWDYLGWHDPWATKAFSERQRFYAQSWHSDSVYTPGFVLNGREWRARSSSKDGPPSPGIKAGILNATSSDLKRWNVSFSPSSEKVGDYEIHAALLENGLISDVKAGENRGRRLSHDFVVTVLLNRACKIENDHAFCEVVMPEVSKDHRSAIAFWVTRLGHFEPLQVVGGWLRQSDAK